MEVRNVHTLTLTSLTSSSTVPQGATVSPSPSESSSESMGCVSLTPYDVTVALGKMQERGRTRSIHTIRISYRDLGYSRREAKQLKLRSSHAVFRGAMWLVSG